MNQDLQQEKHYLMEWLTKEKWHCLLSGLVLFLIWGKWLFNDGMGIDTCIVINEPLSPVNWLEIGRQGGILTEYVFGQRWFNPYVSSAFSIVLLWIACAVFGYVFWRISNARYLIWGGVACFIHPIMAENLYFGMMSFKCAWAYILCFLAVGLNFYTVCKKKIWGGIAAILCMIWIFSTYQAFVLIYIASVVFSFLMYVRNTKGKWDGYVSMIAMSVAIFAIAFATNQIITKLFFLSDIYLENQIQWTINSPSVCIDNIINYIKDAWSGKGIFYSGFYGFFATAAIVVSILESRKWTQMPLKVLYVLAVIGLQISPYLLSIMLGGAPAIRAQLCYPFVLAIDMAYCLTATKWRPYRLIVGVAAIVMIWNAANTTMRLIYTDTVRRQEDERVASEIYWDVQRVCNETKPIVFIGRRASQLTGACLKGELIGVSMLDWSTEVEPHYYSSSNYVKLLYGTIGIHIPLVAPESVQEARKIALNMPCWPDKNAISDQGQYVIVKLSEDQWIWEMVTPQFEEVEVQNGTLVTENEMGAAVNDIFINNDRIGIRGWFILYGKDASDMDMNLYLYDKEEDIYYGTRIIREERTDLVEAFPEEYGELYRMGGFVSVVAVNELNKPIDQYSVFIGVQDNETTYLRNIDQFVSLTRADE